jgi:hypothetical protein
MFTHIDSFGDKLNVWFDDNNGIIVATGNGPADGTCIEMDVRAAERLARYLNDRLAVRTLPVDWSPCDCDDCTNPIR